MFTQKFINEMGGTEMNLDSWEGKYFLRRIALMPAKLSHTFTIDNRNAFLRYSDYESFMQYPGNNLQ